MGKSEFGKGLVVCLAKFYEHFGSDFKDKYGRDAALWANGASDHLYEIEVPDGNDWDNIRKLAIKLQSKGLEMGHGFTNKKYTMRHVEELKHLTKKILLLIDKKIGLTPDWGEW